LTSKSRTQSALEPYLYPIAFLTAAALLIELVALRLLTRTAIHIPGLEQVEIGYRLVSEVGRLAFGAGAVLVVCLIVVAAIDAGVRGGRGLTLALSVFLAAAALAAVGVIGDIALSIATVLVVAAVPFVCRPRGSTRRSWALISPTLFVVAFVVAALPTIAGEMILGLGVPVLGMWQAGEALAIIAGIALVARVPGPLLWRSALLASLVGGLVLAGLVAQPSTVEILMLWNLGLSAYFHPLLYAAGIAGVVYAAHGAWNLGDRSVAIGVALVVAGGIGLHSTIQSAAFLMGVVILADPCVARMAEAEAGQTDSVAILLRRIQGSVPDES
jgi:hypothetical protein